MFSKKTLIKLILFEIPSSSQDAKKRKSHYNYMKFF